MTEPTPAILGICVLAILALCLAYAFGRKDEEE